MTRMTQMCGPAVRCKGKRELESTVLHQCIRPRVGARAPDHHGNPRAPELISGHASKGLCGSSVLGCAGRTISPSLVFLSQTSLGKRSRRLHRMSPDREHFVLIHAAWGAGFIGLTSKLRPPWRTPHTMRAILLASAIASLKRLSRRACSLDPGFKTMPLPALRAQ
jgi:hypothetical protein